MHISVPVSTLMVILVGVIIAGVLLRLAYMRRRWRRAGSTPRARKPSTRQRRPPARTPARKPFIKGIPFPARRARSGNQDHGAEIARHYGRERSPEWPRVEKEHLLIEPACVACGHKGRGLQVHHIKPFHLYPALELDPHNLITLCEIKGRDHHLLLGHLDDWASYNPNVRIDVKRFHKESATQIRANPAWQAEEARRPESQA